MIGYVMVGTSNLEKAIKFYDEILKVLDLKRIDTDNVCAGYGAKDGPGLIEFYVTLPFNKKEVIEDSNSRNCPFLFNWSA